MTAYRLPDGTEVTEYNCTLPKSPQHVWVRHPLFGEITVDKCKLTEVAPPLPPEPPHGFVGRGDGDIWERDDNPEEIGAASVGCHWYRVGDSTVYTWPGVCEDLDTPLIPLVPDPVADAPALPWFASSNDDRYPDLAVQRARDAGDVLDINGIRLSATEIRDLMAICARHLKPGAERDALLRAARDHEEASRA